MEIFKKKSVGFLLLLVFGLGMNSQLLCAAASGGKVVSEVEALQIVPYQDPTGSEQLEPIREDAIVGIVQEKDAKSVTSEAEGFKNLSNITYAQLLTYGYSLFEEYMSSLKITIDNIKANYYDVAVKKINDMKASVPDYVKKVQAQVEDWKGKVGEVVQQAQGQAVALGKILNTIVTDAKNVYDASITAAVAKNDLEVKLKRLQADEGSIKDKMKIVEGIVVDAKKIGAFVKTLNTKLIASLPKEVLSAEQKATIEATLLSSLETLNVIEYLAQLVQKVEGIDLSANVSGKGIAAAARLKMAEATGGKEPLAIEPAPAGNVKKEEVEEPKKEQEMVGPNKPAPAKPKPPQRPNVTLEQALQAGISGKKEEVTPEEVVTEALKDVRVEGRPVNVEKVQEWLGVVGQSASK